MELKEMISEVGIPLQRPADIHQQSSNKIDTLRS